MRYMRHAALITVTSMLLGGCSYKSSEFFEDLFAENHVIKADDGQFRSTVGKDAHAPIMSDQKRKTATVHKKMQTYRGKIAAVHFDRDFNLYVYTFIDALTREPVTFFYDKNIQAKNYNGEYRIRVSGNYLISYKPIKQPKEVFTPKTTQTSKTYQRGKKYKRRKRSSIKIPVEEKINPL